MAGIITDVNTGDGHRLSDDTLRLLENVAASADKVGATSAIESLRLQVKMVMMKRRACVISSPTADLEWSGEKHCEIWAGL